MSDALFKQTPLKENLISTKAMLFSFIKKKKKNKLRCDI